MHSPSTTNKKNFALKNFFVACLDLNVIETSPYNANRCPTIKQILTKPRRVLTDDEARQTIEILNEKYDYYTDPCERKHPMHGCLVIAIYFGLYCGLRTNEMRWLEWDALTMSTKSFVSIKLSKNNNTKEIHTPKTHHYRTIGISDKLKKMIMREEERQNKYGMKGQYIIPSGRFTKPGSKWDKDKNKVGSRGNVVSNNMIADSLLEFNKNEHKIYDNPEFPTYYSYRHTFATNLADHHHLKIVAKRLGHETIATTEKYLSDLDPRKKTVENDLPY